MEVRDGSRPQQYANLVEPALAARGIEVFDVEFAGGRLVVTVDRDGGIDLEALTEANHIVSDLLDEHDPIPDDRYLLEVSSPGLERTLRTPDHFTKCARRDRQRQAPSRRSRASAATKGCSKPQTPKASRCGGRRFAYADIERARTVFAWGPTPKPKGGHPSKPHPKNTNAKADA